MPAIQKMPLFAYTMLFLFAFGASWTGTFAWQNRSLINELFYLASEQRNRILAGDAGPITYLVHHNNYRELEAAVLAHDDVLGIEIWQQPNIAALAFTSIDSKSIAAVENLPMVTEMIKRNVPMICH